MLVYVWCVHYGPCCSHASLADMPGWCCSHASIMLITKGTIQPLIIICMNVCVCVCLVLYVSLSHVLAEGYPSLQVKY
jgi:hypothetical protein